jgi:helicase
MSTTRMHDRISYLKKVRKNLQTILDDAQFDNYRKQVIARKMRASFKHNYNETYLWNRALYMSTNASLLLSERMEIKLAIKCLQNSAQVFEYLGTVSESYDKDYSLLLSSLCYDLAGYQANALCLARQVGEYELDGRNDVDVTIDNYILQHVKRILLKNIVAARADVDHELNHDLGLNLFNESIIKWYNYALDGKGMDFLAGLQESYIYYLNVANIPISQLLFLLRTRLKIYLERSTWLNLGQGNILKDNPIWIKYIKLLAYDAYSHNRTKPIQERISTFELWTSQLRAIQKGLLQENRDFVIQMPTSAGKTFIAELSILSHLLKNPGKKCVYIAPFRALTNEKENEIGKYVSKLGFSVSALSGSYEIDEFQEVILEETDVLIATPEKIDLLLRINPAYFQNVSLIVVDEGQIVGDINPRASLLEFLVIRLKLAIVSARFLFISAVMPINDADDYSTWLSGVSTNVIRALLHPDSPPEEQWEPTRKLIGSFKWDGANGRIDYLNVETGEEGTGQKMGAFVPNFIRLKQYGGKYPTKDNKAETSAALCFELSKDGNSLVFCAQVADTERVGEALLRILSAVEVKDDDLPDYFGINENRESYFSATKWYSTDSYVIKCLRRGIGIHFGDMPEPVRRSVEADYNSGSLRVLISTSTVGQGLNFPIKHMVVHSTIIGYDVQGQHPIKVKVRDFWNIIGRAGRAGKETEGQVIFVVNSYTDGQSFIEYTNRSNIEHAYSMFYAVLRALITQRINEPVFKNYMQILAEPYLQNLLIEEVVGTDDSEIIEKIITNSLFKVQALKAGYDLQPLRKAFVATASSIREAVTNANLLKIYGQTGFMLSSNQVIDQYVDAHMDQLTVIIAEDGFVDLISLILGLFDTGQIAEVISDKLNGLNVKPSQCLEVIRLWMAGKEIDYIQIQWREISQEVNDLNILIADGLYYRYTWGVTAFVTILCHKLGIDWADLPINIRSLPSYIKFGLGNPTACLARSLGIKSRNVAELLSVKYGGKGGKDFIRWLSNLTNEDLFDYEVSEWDKRNILDTALKLNPQRATGVVKTFKFDIRGISYSEDRKRASTIIQSGAKLTYVRDLENAYDPYAIKIFSGMREVGFVPREITRLISTEIDINQKEYQIKVIKTKRIQDFNNISVEMLLMK